MLFCFYFSIKMINNNNNSKKDETIGESTRNLLSRLQKKTNENGLNFWLEKKSFHFEIKLQNPLKFLSFSVLLAMIIMNCFSARGVVWPIAWTSTPHTQHHHGEKGDDYVIL